MNENFNIKDWKYSQLLNESFSQEEGKPISYSDAKKIYEYLIKKLDGPAQEAGLRMSIFEQEFPNASSFMKAVGEINGKSSPMNENYVDHIDKIKIIYTERFRKLYKCLIVIDGKEEKVDKSDLEGIMSSIIGEDVEIPKRYDPETFQPYIIALADEEIEVEYDDSMDVS